MIEPGGLPPSDALKTRAGGKAYNLLKLAALEFPVPVGFVLPTTMCRGWMDTGKPSVAEFKSAYGGTIERLERASGLRFGDFRKPLLVSVRSGAPVSMPGMLDTILNVGLTLNTIPGFIALTGNPRLAWDCYRRLIVSYAESVHGSDAAMFENAASKLLSAAGAKLLSELDTLALRTLAHTTMSIFFDVTGSHFPDDPHVQLLNAIDAVFRSWNSERAVSYRRVNSLSDLPGTAVTVQRMVFGNAGADSGAGVGFTRDPATGEKKTYIDFAFDAQGEDVVSGRTHVCTGGELSRFLPQISDSLEEVAAKLERVFGYAQDFEFTVSEGKLYLLQTRDAKCSDWARLKIAVDLVREGLLSTDAACRHLDGLDPYKLVRKRVITKDQPIALGIPAGLSVATGAIALTVKDACAISAAGQSVILVSHDVLTRDIDGIRAANGVLTARGGRTSHAAVIARELGKVAIVGCRDLHIAADERSCTLNGVSFKPGDMVTVDGETGAVYSGEMPIVNETPEEALATFRSWNCSALH